MGFHIIHIFSHNISVSVNKERIRVFDRKNEKEKFIPLEDVAGIISATPEITLTGYAMRKIAEYDIPLLVCDSKYQPAGIFYSYHSCKNTEMLRSQLELPKATGKNIWRKIVNAKIRNQAAAVENFKLKEIILNLAKDCYSKNPDPLESYAANIYWKNFFKTLNSDEKTRKKRTRSGINGMLDYGYAVIRSAVLRYIAVHGLIAGMGIHHKAREGTFALADDLVEPLRPFVDSAVKNFVLERKKQEINFKEWAITAGKILTNPVLIDKKKIRMLYAIDYYVKSFGKAVVNGNSSFLKPPLLK